MWCHCSQPVFCLHMYKNVTDMCVLFHIYYLQIRETGTQCPLCVCMGGEDDQSIADDESIRMLCVCIRTLVVWHVFEIPAFLTAHSPSSLWCLFSKLSDIHTYTTHAGLHSYITAASQCYVRMYVYIGQECYWYLYVFCFMSRQMRGADTVMCHASGGGAATVEPCGFLHKLLPNNDQ